MKTCPDAYHCPVEATIDIVGGKHKVLILWHLSKHGVLHRELYHQVPPKTEYSLTERGRSFTPVLNAMCKWGGEVLDEMGVEARGKGVE